MRPSVVLPVTIAGIAAIAFILPSIVLWPTTPPGGAAAAGEAATGGPGAYFSIAFGIVLAVAGAAVAFLHARMVRPMLEIQRDADVLARTPQNRELAVPPVHMLDKLPRSVQALSQRLVAARGETAQAIAEATRRAEEQKSRLEAILLDLTEGVIVCNFGHRILLYNQSAARILQMRDALGLGRSLFELLTSAPILHVLEQLTRAAELEKAAAGSAAGSEELVRQSESAPRRFVCATVDLGTLLEARLSLVRDTTGDASGYVLTFADVGQQVDNLALRDSILREVMVEWRRPLANLSAASEMLAGDLDLSAAERHSFEEIVSKEVESLNARFADASRRYERIAAGPWPMSDVHSLDLFRTISKHLEAEDGITVTLVGLPVWLHADSHTLMLAIEHLIRSASRTTGRKAFDLEAEQGDVYTYIEISWDGPVIPSAETNAWISEPLKGTIANRTVAQIIEQHGSELWSKSKGEGRACIRLPIKVTARRIETHSEKIAPRPEYYDFDLFKVADTAIADVPLRKLSFVVFDSETTGLRPSDGDELLSIGAVRVVNGRMLTGETFERLINPGRPIPPASIQFHGITDDMVRDKPPVRIVLPQFRSFVSDSVLIAYNVAFDMKFLELKQEEVGVNFDNPVLDALLLTIYAYADAPDHSLSSMAHQLGIEVVGRHTALGDAMMTAALWVKLIDVLEEKGVTTFGQAVKISTRMMNERKLNTKF